MTQFLSYNWDETTSQWNPIYKREYTFAANGNMTQNNWVLLGRNYKPVEY